MRIDSTDRQILGEALDEPQRQPFDAGANTASLRPLCRHVVLECMYELVAEYIVGFGQRAGQGQHDAALHAFSDASRSLADRPTDGVRLLEVGM